MGSSPEAGMAWGLTRGPTWLVPPGGRLERSEEGVAVECHSITQQMFIEHQQ